VLVDDLVARGVDEPYRLFTSRSEFRLTVRQDNALQRLAAMALDRGMLTEGEEVIVHRRLTDQLEALRLARETSVRPELINDVLIQTGSAPVTQTTRIDELVKRQGVELRGLFAVAGVGASLASEAMVSAELELKYEGYFSRERLQADKLRRMGALPLPEDLPYDAFHSLSHEARQKLAARRPSTLAQAASIPGVNPSDLQNLIIEVERLKRVAAGTLSAS